MTLKFNNMTIWDFLFASLEIFGYYAIATILFGLVIYFIGPKAWDYFISSKIEIEKSNLELLRSNKGNVFNRLHERKLDAYTDLFSKMVLTFQKFSEYADPVKTVPKNITYEDFCVNKQNEFIDMYRSLKISYHNSKILIPIEIEEKIKTIFDKFNELSKNYQEYEIYTLHGVRDADKLDKALKKQLDAGKFIKSEFPSLLDDIVNVFRQDILKHD